MKIYYDSTIDHNAENHTCIGWNPIHEPYKPEGCCYINVLLDDDGYRYREIMGRHDLTFRFAHWQHIDIPAGAWCEFLGERYTLELPAKVVKVSSRNFEYTIVMESSQVLLKKFKFRHILGVDDTSDRGLKFDLTAQPRQHLQMLVDNLNDREGAAVWSIGTVLESVEKHIPYNHTFCMDALTQMANTFETEYEIVDKTIHLCKLEHNLGEEALSILGDDGVRRGLSYGRDNGFISGVNRDNFVEQKTVGLLFVQGGERNIDSSTYGKSAADSDQVGSRVLLLPKGERIQFDGTYFEDNKDEDSNPLMNTEIARTYIVDAHGYSVQRDDIDNNLISKVEDSLDLTTVYPCWEHTVTGSEHIEESDSWDIFDTNNPVDYKGCRIGGETATVIFQSGMLAGKEFDLVQDKTLHGYIHTERRFKLVSQDIDGVRMPGKPNTAFEPKIGDKFKVFGVSLPTEYITKAERTMLKEAVKYLHDNADGKYTITGTIDGLWLKRDWENRSGKIVLGGHVMFYDPQFQVENSFIRIKSIKEYLHNPTSPQIILTNSTVKGSFSSTLRKIKSNEVVVESNRKEAQQFAKRGFRNAQETSKMLEEALLENFTESIKPITINTMQLLVGDESLQFEFVDKAWVEGQTDPVLDANHSIEYDASTKIFTARSGVVRHLTLGIKNVSPTHSAGEYQYWTIGSTFSISSDSLTDQNGRYLYIKAHRTAGTAEYIISETAIAMNSDKPEHANWYHFTCGILNSEINGSRSYASMFGFTEILPGRITTNKIVSADGKTYIDLANGEIGGKMVFVNELGESKTVIDGGYVKTEAIDVDNLTVKKITSSDGQIIIGDGRAKIGDINVNNKEGAGKGSIEIGTGVTLTRGAIRSLSDMLDGKGSGSGRDLIDAVNSNTNGYNIELASIDIQDSGATLRLNTAMSVKTGIFNQSPSYPELPEFTAVASGILQLRRDGVVFEEFRELRASSTGGPGVIVSDSMRINRSWSSVRKGKYTLEYSFHYTLPPAEYGGAYGRVEIESGEISYAHLNPILETEIGDNGIAVVVNGSNYEYTSRDKGKNGEDILKKTFKGTFDVPGVLASYRVDADRVMSNRFGARIEPDDDAFKVAKGHIRVPHKIGHEEYTISAIAHNSVGLIIPTIISRGARHAEIGLRGADGSWWDHGFDITFYGTNR